MTNTPIINPEPLAAGLYIVATPIGNLGDITLRAIDILRRCDVIACEDTRVTGKLLHHLAIPPRPLRRYNDHSDDGDRARLISMIREQAVALVSDAGMPLISDPGYRLVRDARAAGLAITTAPGASAPLAALALSGLPNDRFLFAGFVPAKDQARRAMLEDLGAVRATLILFETGPRLNKTLAALATMLPDRPLAVARELTKLHEECRTGSAQDLLAHYSAHPPRGEIVLLIGPAPDVAPDPAQAEALLRALLVTEKPSRAAAQVARATGLDRHELYARALELRGK